jgi:hypothetical protein
MKANPQNMSNELYEWRLLLGAGVVRPCENSSKDSPFVYSRTVGNRTVEINLQDRLPRCENNAEQLVTIKLPHKQERGFELCTPCQRNLTKWADKEGREYNLSYLPVVPVTQEQAAKLVGVVLNTWSRWEMGHPVENPVMLRRALVQLATERGITIEDYPGPSLRRRITALKDAVANITGKPRTAPATA